MSDKYKWMRPDQKQLYDDLCDIFGFKNLSDIGNYLELNNPYHGAKIILEAARPNPYLKRLVKEKRKDREKIRQLEQKLTEYNDIITSIKESKQNLESSLKILSLIDKSPSTY